jgi:flavin reductase (DIM6/NTAB) family NADH-FMN oxidoreductase RutF
MIRISVQRTTIDFYLDCVLRYGLQSNPDLTLKDTTYNTRMTGEFVVNLVDEDIASQIVACAANFAKGENETDSTGLTLTLSENIGVDYIAEAPIALECRRVTILQFAKTRDLAIGEIIGLYAREGIIDKETLRVNWDNYNPIGRLYADQYIRTHDRFSMSIPSHQDVMSGKYKNQPGE